LVDQLTIQTIGVLVAATSVVLYIANLFITHRKDERTKKITMSQTLLQSILSQESSKNWAELTNARWENFDDFVKKYDSSINPEFFGKRWTAFNTLDLLGYLLKSDLVDAETILRSGGYMAIYLWAMYKPIIEGYHKIAYPNYWYEDFEYLASEMWRMMRKRDPTWLTDRTLFKDDTLVRTFGKT
jgi:hypothetical protein